MPDNLQNQSNALWNSFNGPLDSTQEGMQRLKIETNDSNQDTDMAQPIIYPDRPGEPDCIYYLRTGLCGYGSNCRFNHPAQPTKTVQSKVELPQRVGQPACGYYLKTGNCKYGSTCKYHHPRDRRGAGQVTLNVLGLPMRQEAKSCAYYMRTYSCKYGAACKFHHPPPPSTEVVLPGAAAVGSIVSSVLPSTVLPYIGVVPTWLLPRTPYMSGPRGGDPRTYIPFTFSPQGTMATQGWNTYVGNLTAVSSSSTLGTSFVYNSKDQSESGISGQVNALAANLSHLPERPDQPECRYFMSTGGCKYGSDCKYHHPKERIAQLATSSLGPHGLPLRPGEVACSYFTAYGICKYGPTCKFDHPITGYFSNYSFSMPSLSMFDQSFFLYPRNLPSTNSSETRPSKSKITEWIQKPENAEEKDQCSDVNAPEDAQEQTDKNQHASPASTELSPDQSD
ncbi:hypothetical protein Ancab_010858 [Ancistrocladus abbreviatus]